MEGDLPNTSKTSRDSTDRPLNIPVFFFCCCFCFRSKVLIKSELFVTGCVADFQNAEESGFRLHVVLLCVDEEEDMKRRALTA